MEYDSIHEELVQILNETGRQINIIEAQIDVELQLDFFEQIENNKDVELDFYKAENQLFDDIVTIEEKKILLVQLSISSNVQAYKLIKRFHETKPQNLFGWTTLALQHSQINLESDLLDEKQLFISTGLGGDKDSLRYFFANRLKLKTEFTDSQKKIIRNEFKYVFNKHQSKIEEYYFDECYFVFVALIPIAESINTIIQQAIVETNNFGNFLDIEYLVTNVKKLGKSDIDNYFKKKTV
ncbi:MAG: hypothetical protein MI739_11850 [Bacteroidales bacterium]|nr:hypothetical protein [Bacteroidales bacterium]